MPVRELPLNRLLAAPLCGRAREAGGKSCGFASYGDIEECGASKDRSREPGRPSQQGDRAMRSFSVKARLLALLPLVLAVSARAAEPTLPETLSYQGVLVDTGGVPRTGNVSLTLRIFDQLTGGTLVYTQSFAAVPLDRWRLHRRARSERSGDRRADQSAHDEPFPGSHRGCGRYRAAALPRGDGRCPGAAGAHADPDRALRPAVRPRRHRRAPPRRRPSRQRSRQSAAFPRRC